MCQNLGKIKDIKNNINECMKVSGFSFHIQGVKVLVEINYYIKVG